MNRVLIAKNAILIMIAIAVVSLWGGLAISHPRADTSPPTFLTENRQEIPTNAGWGYTITGDGEIVQSPFRIKVQTGWAPSSIIAHTLAYGFSNENGHGSGINFSRPIWLAFKVKRAEGGSRAIEAKVQLKLSNGIGDLDNTGEGIGIHVANYSVKAEAKESYKQYYSPVFQTMADDTWYPISIYVDGLSDIAMWYLDETLVAETPIPGAVPSGSSNVAPYLVMSITNGVTSQHAAISIAQVRMWQP